MVTLKDARDVTHIIVDLLQPILVVIFGSVAKDGSGTDLDLLIKLIERYDNAILLGKLYDW